ncbi:MAG TPA: endonuclease/exonuclease/phosphatase family protein [Solirubrobacterales bacterium]|nr:endonuclease/exonuclease/phosphatase family protein [Solirubrobacterales bacterium]
MGLIAVLGLALLPGVADAAGKKKKGKLTVMSRNLYLGADLTPALQANTIDQAIDAGGEIVNQVHATKFPSIRAASIAAEIKKRKPDIVGLQEAALWRTGPVNFAAALGSPVATQVDPLGGDFIADLLGQLNKGKKKKGKKPLRYGLAVVKPEFDFELPVNDDGNGNGLAGADHNERLTMRDAILVRKGIGVKFSNPTVGTFDTLLRVELAGGVRTIDVTRGWAAINVKARGRSFHAVDAHLEAFDSRGSNTTNHNTTVGRGDIRAAQAAQLVQPQPNGANRAGKIPTILIGDMNSDDDTVANNGDRNAYSALLAGGFTERSTSNPLSCCLNDPFLVGGPNSINDFDHQVDHVLANRARVKFVKGFVDGRAPVNGLYPSDHAALTSVLRIK